MIAPDSFKTSESKPEQGIDQNQPQQGIDQKSPTTTIFVLHIHSISLRKKYIISNYFPLNWLKVDIILQHFVS